MTEERYHVACDLDDVILDLKDALIRCVRKEYGVDLTERFEDGYWDLHAIIDPVIGKSWWSWWRKRSRLWTKADAVDGAIGGLQKLRDAGYYLEIVTSKPEWAEPLVWEWLGKWQPAVHRVTIVTLEDSKADITSADVLIDDKPKNVNEFAEAGGRGILFDTPSNQGVGLPSGVYRAIGWEQVVELVHMDYNGELE